MQFENANFNPFLWAAVFELMQGSEDRAREIVVEVRSRLPRTATAKRFKSANHPLFDREPWKPFLPKLVALGLPEE